MVIVRPQTTLQIGYGRGPKGDTGTGITAESFETFSKNLPAANAVPTYEGGNLAAITYANGVVKTFGYGDVGLHTVTLSGAIPPNISTVKTLQYDLNGNWVASTYA